uniref:Uncharacterized protein n=1 Tax=Chromera velia CCMP2878 TaxID=1169474 RepID=A0A0G4I9I3_9ALVE|eukprot:Cvel_12281.t1-p1 / transcript=Cvel_12281.t1 / gene=Cvel_12281 / organism=Chromera_velia_CCMP2878 / gene_product=hypothetical protein / transcript_product=hypothetical protein / location=Cvel_scaffold796:66840-67645(-) / protein_length=107 / sequence_SO=supercontig / SO=protein_coding / is_pseudo=false
MEEMLEGTEEEECPWERMYLEAQEKLGDEEVERIHAQCHPSGGVHVFPTSLPDAAPPSGKVILVDGQGGVHQSWNAAVCGRAAFTPVWKAYLSLLCAFPCSEVWHRG